MRNAHNYLNSHAGSNGSKSLSDAAVQAMERALVAVAAWPKPFAKGAQANQIRDLVDELAHSQDDRIEHLLVRHAHLREDIEALHADSSSRHRDLAESLAEYEARAAKVEASVDSEKARIDDIVAKGADRISLLSLENEDAFKAWAKEHDDAWNATKKQHWDALNSVLKNANSSLEAIRASETEYKNISSAAAAGKLAHEYEEDAKAGKKLGLTLYALGAVFLLASALPLMWILVDQQGSADKQWQQFAARLAIGIIAASGATVLIRLGARFIENASSAKKMALELRTMGPFLANVEDKASVDSARLEFVDRAFGKSYAPANADEKDEGVSVTAFSHIIDLVKALNK